MDGMKRIAKLAGTGALIFTLAYLGFTPAGLGFFGQPARVPTLAELTEANPGTTAYMEIRRREAEALGKKWRPRFTWVPFARVSPALVNAVLAAEDSTFYQHHGIEWGLTRDALLENLRRGEKARGASTITQQVARNLYLSPQKSYLRKIREMILAQRLEQTLTKRRILEIYLNIAEWGPGVFGVEAAAQTYFGKPASDLNWEEAVSLTAVLPSPLRHAANADRPWVNLRRQWVWSRLVETRRYTPPPANPAVPAPSNSGG